MTDDVLTIRIKRGLDLAIEGAPEQRVRDGAPVRTVALQGGDHPQVRPSLAVKIGEAVVRGQTLFSDRKRPAVKFTAPVSGNVLSIDRGPRRSFSSLRIGVEGNDAITFDTPGDSPQGSDVRALLLASGLWPALRSRPFSAMPDPDAVTHRIFVTAMASEPLSPDAAVVIAGHGEHFRRGVRWLTALTDGKVFVCQRPGPPLIGEEMTGVVTAVFEGPHPAGLAGTHIHHLAPASREKPVWHIGYQDVIAIGHLAGTGQLWSQRVVALGGPALSAPALYRTLPGANLLDLMADILPGRSLGGQPLRILSGSPLSGRESAYLGRFHDQASVLHARPGKAPRSFWARVFAPAQRGPGDALIPHEALEGVLPFDIYPVPLMRALSAGDTDAARRLGCLQLADEDLALLSYLCTSGADYGRLLRSALDELEPGA